tara:strand:- start:2117 stop:2257 length:141 start_codon:yes stop_codon:yes gene_type:complete
MMVGTKGALILEKLVKMIVIILVLLFLFFLLRKIVNVGDLFVGLFD